MKLIDLEPKWLSPDLFIFKNPTGGDDWLTCKNKAMTRREQCDVTKQYPEYGSIVLTVPDVGWSISGTDFNTMSVTPSIDASKSGNWHGFITNGEIVGGI